MAAATANKEDTTTKAQPPADPNEDTITTAQPPAEPVKVTPAPAAPVAPAYVAIGYSPEVQEPSLRSCAGGDLCMHFGKIGNKTEGPELRLRPGLNARVPMHLWQKAIQTQRIQELQFLNVIQVVPLTEELAYLPEQDPAVFQLEKVEKNAARLLVLCSRNKKQLEAWLLREGRDEVAATIRRRLRDIDRPEEQR